MLHLQIMLVIISIAGLELRSEPNRVMVGFERTNLGDSEIGESQQADDADESEGDRCERHDAQSLLGLGRERFGWWITDPGDRGRGPSDPPSAAYQP